MDRREFLETVVAGTATTPVVARSAQAAASGSAPPHGSAEAAPEASPRLRENFNRGWRFARQSQGRARWVHSTGRTKRPPRSSPLSRSPPVRIRRRRLGCHQPAPHLERLRFHGRGAGLLAGNWLVPKALQAGHVSIPARPFFLNLKAPAASRSFGSMANASVSTRVVTPALNWM